MVEPVSVENMFIVFVISAAIVVSGLLYGLLFLLSRMWRQAWLLPSAYVVFAVLVACVLMLAEIMRLDGFWRLMVAAMLAGYLLAPRVIWRLCIATHAGDDPMAGNR
ncbi:MAG: hypothetical protein RQ867_02710 [Mariprofundaceae bacterium]|nr:hypothetical protein [Mariprofundaceae bacterium]